MLMLVYQFKFIPMMLMPKTYEHELGKTECWYVIHAEPGAYLTYGHTAKHALNLLK